MFIRVYNADTDELIPRNHRSDHWDVARVPCMNESVALWIDGAPVTFIVDDVLTECDENRVNYSINVTPLNSPTLRGDNADTTKQQQT